MIYGNRGYSGTAYIHSTYNLYLYTIKDVKAKKLVGSCTNKIHKIATINR